jgi:hypothetical protein
MAFQQMMELTSRAYEQIMSRFDLGSCPPGDETAAGSPEPEVDAVPMSPEHGEESHCPDQPAADAGPTDHGEGTTSAFKD